MKILLSAFSCCPGRGSEPGVGWNWVDQISRRHEVWLLTSDEFQQEIQEALTPTIHPTFIPSFKRWHWLQKRFIPGLHWLYYYWWQWKAYRIARRLHARVRFDLAHHATFVSWRAPSFVSLLPVPFIWGPVGGGGTPPRGLASELGWKGRLEEGFRAWCQFLPRFDPCVRLTMRRAAVILANIPETAELIPKSQRSKVRLMFGIGMPITAPTYAEHAASNAPEGFLVLVAAQLRPIKGTTLALRAFAELTQQHPESSLVVLGEGPEKRRLEILAEQLKIRNRVKFLGWVPHEEVQRWMQKADVLLHPSLRDSGGMVLLEAMMQKKPVICLDLGGPGNIVTTDCGFKVSPSGPRQTVKHLGEALERLANQPELSRRMGEAGFQRVRSGFDWNRRGEEMDGIYLLTRSAQSTPAPGSSTSLLVPRI